MHFIKKLCSILFRLLPPSFCANIFVYLIKYPLFRGLKYFCLIFIFTGITSCTPTANVSYSLLTVSPPENGFFVMEILVNFKRIAGPLKEWTEIHLQKVTEEKPESYKVVALKSEFGKSFFIGNLPPGEYRFNFLKSEIRTTARFEGYSKIPDDFGSFEIKKGEITNLGTMIFHPVEFISLFQSEIPYHKLARVRNKSLIDRFNAAVSQNQFHYDEALGWKHNEQIEFSNEAELEEVLKNPEKTSKVFRLKEQSGSLILAKLGSFFYNSNNSGIWKRHSLHSLYPLLSFVELSKEKWLFGGENGLLHLYNPLTEQVRRIAPPDQKASVFELGYLKIGKYYLITLKDDIYKFYFFDPATYTYSLEKTFNKKLHSPGIIDSSKPVVVDVNGYSFDIFINKERHTFNSGIHDWNVQKDKELLYSHSQLNGITVANPLQVLLKNNTLLFSLDEGLSWTDTKATIYSTDYLLSTVYIASDSTLIQVKDPTPIFGVNSEKNSRSSVLVSEDLGETWDTISSVPLGCNCVLNTISSDSSIYVLCENGDIIVSGDGGVEWEKEHIY